MMKLIGSTTSPFVRRIRLLLAGKEYDFQCVNIFSIEGQQAIAQYTNTGRIPILVDGKTIIWDSLLISQYLSKNTIDLESQKELILINELTDAGIQLFQLRKFETDPKDQGQFSKNNLKRMSKILKYFEDKNITQWNIITQWLFCTLDWFDFRETYPWRKTHTNLVNLHKKYSELAEIKQTDPRDID